MGIRIAGSRSDPRNGAEALERQMGWVAVESPFADGVAMVRGNHDSLRVNVVEQQFDFFEHVVESGAIVLPYLRGFDRPILKQPPDVRRRFFSPTPLWISVASDSRPRRTDCAVACSGR